MTRWPAVSGSREVLYGVVLSSGRRGGIRHRDGLGISIVTSLGIRIVTSLDRGKLDCGRKNG